MPYSGGDGYPLGTVYLIWAGVLLLLYPFCWWFDRLKRRSSGGVLSYL
jgi:hypothetical protein